MSSSEENATLLGAAYLASHPYLEADIEIVGVEAIADINAAVGTVREASSHLVSPCFDPRGIHH